VRVSLVLAALAAAVAGCSSGSRCPLTAPGTGDPCSGGATCTYGPVTCSCSQQTWQCDLPFSPEVTPGQGSDDGGAPSVGGE
jgi:hypothetical protein